ncbi:MAG: hypothetical protein Sylvanvirus7_42, partial [Sylvanvirus sp.]
MNYIKLTHQKRKACSINERCSFLKAKNPSADKILNL